MLRRRLDEELAAATGGRLPEARLAPAVRETIVACAELGDVEPLVRYYARELPAALVEQRLDARDAPAGWLRRDAAALPRLREALEGLYRVLGADAPSFLGAPDPATLLATRPTIEALYAASLFGSCAPLVGALPAERAAMARAAGTPDELLDLRLSGNVIHELSHGPPLEMDGPPPPWTILEAAALHLGARARPAHVFPDVAGEAVRAVSLFVLVGDGLARLAGTRAPVRLLLGEPAAAVLGEATAARLARAGWQAWKRRRIPPFVADALDAEAWLKLLAGAAVEGDDLLGGAGRVPWRELPWYGAEPTDEDDRFVGTGVTALFQANVLAPDFQTVPSPLPGDELHLDVPGCTLAARSRPEGVFGEPARWLFPPPLARRLAERGARAVHVRGARREGRGEVARALVELARGDGALRQTVVLDFRA